MISCIIVEDEPVARGILRQFIQDTDLLELKAEFEDAVSALSFLKENDVDLIFLDIHMPKLTGIGFLKSLSNPPEVILTTAYSEYALEGFELDVIDYLLKPFSFERFLKAVNKVERKHEEEISPDLLIKADGKLYKISQSEVLFVESLGDYVTLNCIGKKLTFNRTLKSILSELSQDKFLQVHKSFIVSLESIEYLEGNMIHIDGKDIPIGNSYKESFLKEFKKGK